MSIKHQFLLFCVILAPSAYACGPWLPEPYVLRNDDFFYAPPEVGFAAELRHLLPESVPHAAALDSEAAGGESSVEELQTALAELGVSNDKIATLVVAYSELREQLNSVKPYLERAPFAYYDPGVDETQRDAKLHLLQQLEVPEDLPAEFRLYLEGALAYYRNDHDAALESWQAVLDLPAGERQYRSVMAAYMIAKACPQSALAYYPMVRTLAAEGYADLFGLAAASYGKEARVFLDRDQYQSAIDLYLQQWASGYSNAVRSLKLVAAQVFEEYNNAYVMNLAKTARGRAVLTAYLLTQRGGERADQLRDRFLAVLPDVDTMTMPEAGRFALMEYQRNNLSSAKLWISYAAPEDALALWVKSKLLLRAGQIDAGRTLLLALTEEMDAKGEDWRRLDTSRAWGELGLLMLREERYAEAADAFWNARSWQDCAYVLERLLNLEQLVAWVDAHAATGDDDNDNYYDGEPRTLLARRLMRAARFDQALEYFSADHKQHAQAYIKAMRLASDSTQDAVTRARHYWEAARAMRDHGMQLFAAELSPDFAWLGGSYDWGDIATQREEDRYNAVYRINRSTWAEYKLTQQAQVLPNKRFHYRYRALQLAELAAGLLPNNHEQAARIYCVAGNWLKNSDPYVADRLYKQLVVRCPETELGQAAAKVNWFPQIDLAAIEPFTP